MLIWELLKSQGKPENQQVVFMSDGSANARRVQEYLHPFSEGIAGGAVRDGHGRIEAPREREASALARKHRGSLGAPGRSDDGTESDSGAFRPGKESGRRPGGVR